ncbi:MAG: helicase-associated domain-containing protein [Planctomycetota bacterium]
MTSSPRKDSSTDASSGTSSAGGTRSIRSRKSSRGASAKITGRGASGSSGLTVAAALKRLRKPELAQSFQFWAGDSTAPPPTKVADLRAKLADWMSDPERVAARSAALSGSQRSVLEAFLAAPKHRRTHGDLQATIAGEASEEVDSLKRAALVFDDEAKDEEGPAWVIPADLANTLLVQSIERAANSTSRVLTLKGHLEKTYAGADAARPMSPARLRATFKMYSNEAAAVARVERLPEGLRDLIGKVVLEFGGLLPRRFFERMETELPHWNQRRWAKILEESLVGTAQRLELERYGIAHDDDTLIVFNEVSLAWFKRVAVPSDPDAPHDDASLGVDLVANISRFLAYIIDHAVRFTVKGEIFKTTEKRILTELIPNPGRELERSEVLQFIFHFCRAHGLIEVTGQRTFKLTSIGREWEAQTLEEKLAGLFAYINRDVEEAHQALHHPTMRQLLVTMCKRLEVGVWYDVMYLPFLARNAYLSQLDSLGVEARCADLEGGAAPHEDLQRLAWNLVSWVRKRLYLLGIVDLGYDSAGHPVAMKLTRIGARVLGMEDPGPETVGLGRLIVTPDMEVMLFPEPGSDDADLTHDLDRFADRVRDGAMRQFKLSESSVHRGLVEGMTLSRMIEVLTRNARTPVPQNVTTSMRGWALKAGLMILDKDHVVHAEDPMLLARFARDAGVRPFIRSTLSDRKVQLKTKTSRARYRTLFRDLDYLVEVDE